MFHQLYITSGACSDCFYATMYMQFNNSFHFIKYNLLLLPSVTFFCFKLFYKGVNENLWQGPFHHRQN